MVQRTDDQIRVWYHSAIQAPPDSAHILNHHLLTNVRVNLMDLHTGQQHTGIAHTRKYPGPMEGPYLFNGQFPAHFLYFCLFNTAVNINFAADWIRTADLCCQKRPLYQLCHNHCTISVDSWYMIFYSALGINKQTDTRGCWIWGEGRRMSITSKFWILCKSKDATIASSSCRYFSTQK